MRYNNDFENLKMYWKAGLLTTKHALDDKGVQQLINDENSYFDLVISEQFAQESFLMFAHKFQCPFITIGENLNWIFIEVFFFTISIFISGTLGWSDYMDRNFGLTTPWSYVPHPIPLFSKEMTFMERCYNILFSLIDKVVRYFYYIPAQDKLAKEYFGKAIGGEFKRNSIKLILTYFALISGDLPYIGDLERQVSVMLINHHRALAPIRPLMPGQINVAGAHIKPPQPLPEDLMVRIYSNLTFHQGSKNLFSGISGHIA